MDKLKISSLRAQLRTTGDNPRFQDQPL